MTRAATNKLSSTEPRAGAGERLCVPRDIVCLTNGRYSVRFSARGGGQSLWGKLAVTRSSGDAVCDADGFHVYLRDLDDNFVWSAGYQPTRVAADDYGFCCHGGIAEIARLDRGIECRLSVSVAPDHDCEVRRCRLINHGNRARRIELTSYLEWVLAPQEADANHPVFSKLFVETRYCPERCAIVARRRPRSSDDAEIWGFHSLAGYTVRPLDRMQFETSRVAFIGRGGTLKRPRALNSNSSPGLEGRQGPVLDPIGSLRVAIELKPDESGELVFLLGAATERQEIDQMLAAFRDTSGAAAIVGEARNNDASHETSFGDTLQATSRAERIVVHSAHGSPRKQNLDEPAADRYEPAPPATAATFSRRIKLPEPLQFDNGYGGFSADGREYIVRVKPGPSGQQLRPPMPWVNVVANEGAGFLVSESGAGYMWAGNSRLNRISAWHNDPVCDPHAEAIWIRDEDAGVFWSVTPGPTPAPADYLVRHGFGYTVFEHESYELGQETTMFMAGRDPVKITRLRLVNRSGRPRRLSLFSYVHWLLGGLTCETSKSISTEYDSERRAILAKNPERDIYGGHLAFSAVLLPLPPGEGSWTCDRAAFLGDAGDIAAPAALRSPGDLDSRVGGGLDPCAAWCLPIELPPGGDCEVVFLLGDAACPDAAAQLIDSYRAANRVNDELEAAKASWTKLLSGIEIETPDREIDLMVNGWLTYQNLSCRIWGRSAYYQPGGAFGFRDQLQDAAALLLTRPEMTRAQILCHAAAQFVEGDVLHWWHADTGFGLRTRFSDDLLWLPYVTASYVETTGDASVLDEEPPFITASEVPAGHVETYLRPAPSGEYGSVYEHCCRALDLSLTTGAHGLPLIGSGDWNDGFSAVGREGRGESVWLGFFLHFVLGQFLPFCRERGDDTRVARYAAYRVQLEKALNSAGWDGAWYRRAYYDNGQPMGSRESDECQIDAIAQAWAVLSRVAPADRAGMAMKAVEERLVCPEAGMIRLLAPPFDRTPNDPGYIKGYLPGIRENGGQYTHGVLWVVRALAEMGCGTRAVELLRMLSPVWHTSTPERTDVYQTEPYVVAADIYGAPPHVGRGGWTWYTGSAGWMFRVAVESIFGISIERGRTLVVKPAISKSWPHCRLAYRLPNESTRYEVTIENPDGHETNVNTATLDGGEIEVSNGAARVPLVHDGGVHRVVVWL
jgi:cyclic beta-1,2-glucan synthetase